VDRLTAFPNAGAQRADLNAVQRAGPNEAQRVCRIVVGQMTVFLIGEARRVALSEVRRAGRNEVRKVDPNVADLTMIFRIVVVPMICRNAVVLMTVYPIAEAPKADPNAEVRRTYLNEAQRADPSLVPPDVRRSPDVALHANRAGRQIWNHASPETGNPAAVKRASTRTDDPPAILNSSVWDRIAYRVCCFRHFDGRQIWSSWTSRRPAAHRTALREARKRVAALPDIPNLRQVV
jgi:hypothetical protein